MLSKEKNDWLLTVLKVNLNLADVKTDEVGADGTIPLARGEHYEGEHERAGWRGDTLKRRPGETDEDYESRKADFAEREDFVTRAFDDEERKSNTITIDDDGVMRDGNGKVLDKKNIYAVDSKTGEMVVNPDRGYMIREMNSDGTPGEFRATSSMNAIDEFTKARKNGENVRLEVNHHTTPLKGADVAGAGYVTAKSGIIESISNASGHYKPQFVHLLQVVEGLLKSGALLEKDIVTHKGEDLASVSPKAKALYDKVRPLLAELPANKKELTEGLKSLEKEELEEAETAELEATVTSLGKKIEIVGKAMTVLGKMGVGPSNKMRDATVEYTYAKPVGDGNSFLTAGSEEIKLKDFVSGGDAIDAPGQKSPLNRQKDPRKDMMEELKKVAKENLLLPEDREKKAREEKAEKGEEWKEEDRQVWAGQAPEVDLEDWNKDVEDAAAALAEFTGDDGAEENLLMPASEFDSDEDLENSVDRALLQSGDLSETEFFEPDLGLEDSTESEDEEDFFAVFGEKPDKNKQKDELTDTSDELTDSSEDLGASLDLAAFQGGDLSENGFFYPGTGSQDTGEDSDDEFSDPSPFSGAPEETDGDELFPTDFSYPPNVDDPKD